MTTDYKDYALDNLKNWLHDCLNSGEATPEEIYNTIKEVVKEENEYYQQGLDKTQSLLRRLDGKPSVFTNTTFANSPYFHDNMNGVSFYNLSTPKSSEEQSDTIKFETNSNVIKWVVKIQEDSYGLFVPLPDDLCTTLSLKDQDSIEFVNNRNGTITIKKAN
jgi:hypothetical protein